MLIEWINESLLCKKCMMKEKYEEKGDQSI